MVDVIGEMVGNFRVISELGRGGMGEVWLAEHKDIHTRVAVKVLLPQISANRQHVQRFFNEAIAAAKIKHAGIVRIFDVGFHGTHAYLVMELLEGESLSSRLARVGRMSLAGLCDLGRQIASILAATHAEGITHRDLKPDNIYVVRDAELAGGERVKLLDFGIAKLSGGTGGLTGTAMSMGTPAYMSPEQWQDSGKVDHRADAYSLGCVLFELATGRPPFAFESFAAACHQHLNEPPPSLRALAPDMPAALDALAQRLMAKQPEQRPTMPEVVATLQGMVAAHLGPSDPTVAAARPVAAAPSAPDRTAILPSSASAGQHQTTLSALHAAGAQGRPSPARAPAKRPWLAVGVACAIAAIGAMVGLVARPRAGAEGSAPPATSGASGNAAPAAPPDGRGTEAPSRAMTVAPDGSAGGRPEAVPADAGTVAMDAGGGGPAVAPIPPTDAAEAALPSEAERRLETLKRLHDDGTINEQEYARRRAAVLKDL